MQYGTEFCAKAVNHEFFKLRMQYGTLDELCKKFRTVSKLRMQYGTKSYLKNFSLKISKLRMQYGTQSIVMCPGY